MLDRLSEAICIELIEYFQGPYPEAERIRQKAKNATDTEFTDIMYSNENILIKKHGVDIDIKTLLTLAKTCRNFHDLIIESDYGKRLWNKCYASMLKPVINNRSKHIGPVNWKRCGHTNNELCQNPTHYTNNTPKCRNYTNPLSKVARALFLRQRHYIYWNKEHELRRLCAKRQKINATLEKLKQEKRITELNLVDIYLPYISAKEAVSYITSKNKCNQIMSDDSTSISKFFEEDPFLIDNYSDIDDDDSRSFARAN